MQKRVFNLLAIFLFLMGFVRAHAEKAVDDDAYDPFTDYSDFEETTEEEADINFFKNGRFLNIGLAVGSEVFTDKLGSLTKAATPIGFFIGYFFDLRFALMVGFYSGAHDLVLENRGETIRTSIGLSRIAVNFKYFLNTQNVTRGFANLNPFVQAGFSSFTRTISEEDNLATGNDSTTGFDIGMGIEFPILDNRLFLGFEAMYHAVNFKDETEPVPVGTPPKDFFLTGDVATFNLNIGTNF